MNDYTNYSFINGGSNSVSSILDSITRLHSVGENGGVNRGPIIGYLDFAGGGFSQGDAYTLVDVLGVNPEITNLPGGRSKQRFWPIVGLLIFAFIFWFFTFRKQ